jgi:DNA gyrase subunit B
MRDGQWEECYFKEGVFDKRTQGAGGVTGTLVEWQPSEEFFTNTIVEISKIKTLFKTIACLCPGLTIILTVDGKTEEFKSEFGLNDLVDEAVKDKEIINNRLVLNWAEDKNKLDLVMTYTSNYSGTIIPYVNAGLTESGPHITQMKTAITREMNKFFRDKKWLKEKDENLTGDDIQEGMYIVFNMTASNVKYDAQVKSRITGIESKPFVQAFSEALSSWLEINEKDIKIVADKALNARKAREAAKKARDAAREVKPKDKKKQLLNLPTKLVDCWSKDRMKCELLIAEGDSAANGLVEGRDSEIHAIFPIRGKIIAAYKNSAEKIFANQEVVNLIKAIGLDLDPKSHKLIYDVKKLRYGKILLCADADPDGASIRNLLIEMFWWLCPELVLNGHLYTTMPPLFRITTKKNEYIYLKDAEALEQYKTQHQGEKFQINRNKGLGEQDAEELSEALLDPETRNIAQIIVEDKNTTALLMETLLGPSVPPRRAFLLEHEEEANEQD